MTISLFILVDRDSKIWYTGNTFKIVDNFRIKNNINAQIVELKGEL